MSSFNVLSSATSVHRPLLLEASAGTGKTFAIENIVLRLIIESPQGGGEPLGIDQILVSTFTKAAARDLVSRIRTNLEAALSLINQFLIGKNPAMPEFLHAHLQASLESARRAKRRLEQALLDFDQAQISTVHSFCWRMLRNYALESGMSLDSANKEEGREVADWMKQAVRDFIRTELLPEHYHPSQMEILLKGVQGSVVKLMQNLCKELDKGIDLPPQPTFTELCHQFQAAMARIRATYQFEGAKICADFLAAAPSYKGLCDRSKRINPEVMKKIERFAALFDQTTGSSEDFALLIQDDLFILQALHPSKLAAKKADPTAQLAYPHLCGVVRQELGPIVSQARSPQLLFARLARECRLFWERCRGEEELFGHHDLLLEMRRNLANKFFVEKIRSHYRAVIVDEFQDTDQVQWEIFHTLFGTPLWSGYFHIVGDPKQSIYAFRQADIYTYLAAAQVLGTSAHATLDSNYRSQPALIDALNALFHAVTDLFPLPKSHRGCASLPYRTVQAGKKEVLFPDQGAAIQFWMVKLSSSKRTAKAAVREWEGRFFVPAIAQEILRLRQAQGIAFRSCAILVADRYQKREVEAYLKLCGIPYRCQKESGDARQEALYLMKELLHGILRYKKNGLQQLLGGRLVNLRLADLDIVEGQVVKAQQLSLLQSLRQTLIDRGFLHFYPLFMQSSWHADGSTVLQKLLQQQDGAEFYADWQEVADLLMAEEARRGLSPEELLRYLDEWQAQSSAQEEGFPTFFDAAADQVSVLTTHGSKGLEFELVFALGLLRGSPEPERFVSVEQQGRQWREPIAEPDDPRYLAHCQEIDAEKMRQFYVALTRAKFRVYIPVPIVENRCDRPLPGTASPIDLFLAKCGAPALDYAALYERIYSQDGAAFRAFLAQAPATISHLFLEEQQQPAAFKPEQPTGLPLLPAKTFSIRPVSQSMQSFSSLTTTHEEAEVLGAPHDFAAAIKSAHTLPSGAATGILLHKLLEEVPFEQVKELAHASQLDSLLHPFLSDTIYEPWREVICSLVFHALHTPLWNGKEHFRLVDLDPDKIYRETDFLYLCPAPNMFEGVSLKPGFLKGVIDLFFEYQGRYYFLDWKSNWLGPSSEFYSTQHLTQAMHANNYFLQAKIYREALQRYLRNFDHKPFSKLFGGAYYLFLRGLEEGTGAFFLGDSVP